MQLDPVTHMLMLMLAGAGHAPPQQGLHQDHPLSTFQPPGPGGIQTADQRNQLRSMFAARLAAMSQQGPLGWPQQMPPPQQQFPPIPLAPRR